MNKKTFKKRIKLSKFRLQGFLNSEIMRFTYLGRSFDKVLENVIETFDRITGGRYKDNESI